MADRYIVITGAASGIGYAVAESQLRCCNKVIAVDLNADRLLERFGDNPSVKTIACDLTTDEGFKYLTSEIKAACDGVGGFVHAAGIDVMSPIGLIHPAAMQKLFAIHAIFPVRFLGWMIKKGNHTEKASCVLISSLSAHEGAKGHVAYAAAKGAVEGILKPAAAELLDKGIRLNAVVLGVVETEMSQGWIKKLTIEQKTRLGHDYPLGLGTPEMVADTVDFLLSQNARWIAGQTLVCDGGHNLI